MMKLIDLYFDSTSVILASRVKRSGLHLVLSGGSLVSSGMCYLVCFALSDKKHTFFPALAAGIHIPSATVCISLLPEDWMLSTWTERMSLDTALCRGKAQSFHTPPDPSEGAEYPRGLFFTSPGMHI